MLGMKQSDNFFTYISKDRAMQPQKHADVCFALHRGLITNINNMGLDARKPVFVVLRITQAQTSLCIRAV